MGVLAWQISFMCAFHLWLYKHIWQNVRVLTRRIQSEPMLFNSCCMFGCSGFGWSAVCVVVLDFELVFGCERVGREEMLTGRSKVLTVKETVPEIRHGSIETSTYSGKRRKHTLIYAFKDTILLKQNNCYYFPICLSYLIYFCLYTTSHIYSFWTFTHFPGLYNAILNSDTHTHNVCVIAYDTVWVFL